MKAEDKLESRAWVKSYQLVARIMGNVWTNENLKRAVELGHVLRRAQLTLHRWCEEEANGTIQREGENADGKPLRVTQVQFRHGVQEYRERVPDREAGALRRVKAVCEAAGLFHYYQRDPRGCALWVAAVPLDHSNYSSVGVACV